MGWRFRKSVKIAPGVKLNFSKKSTSVTVGNKYARTTINTKGKRTNSVSIPGTGLSYVETTGGKKKEKSKPPAGADLTAQEHIRRIKTNRVTLSVFFVVLALIVAMCCNSGGGMIAALVVGILAALLVNTNASHKIKTLEAEMEEEP